MKRVRSLVVLVGAVILSLFVSMPAQAATYDPYTVTFLPTKVLAGEIEEPAQALGIRVYYVSSNMSALQALNIQTQCISSNMHVTWYGLTARQCKANDATGAQFTIFNSSTGKMVARVNLKPVKIPPIGKSISLGCAVSAAGFALSIPGSPTSVVGWMLKGASVIVAVAGISVSCP